MQLQSLFYKIRLNIVNKALSSLRVQEVINSAYQKLMSSTSDASEKAAIPKQTFCWALNETICDFTTDAANADQVLISRLGAIGRRNDYWLLISEH